MGWDRAVMGGTGGIVQVGLCSLLREWEAPTGMWLVEAGEPFRQCSACESPSDIRCAAVYGGDIK